MTDLTAVEREFVSRGLIRGGILFLRVDEAIEMVKRCREVKVQVIGIDAFILTDRTTQPVMEQSIDLSVPYPKPDSCDRAEKFLRKHIDQDFFFEVVVDRQ
jgi:hypothetical protein